MATALGRCGYGGYDGATSPYLSLFFPYMWGGVSIPPTPCVSLGSVCIFHMCLFSFSVAKPHALHWTKSTPSEFSSLAGGMVFQV